MVEDLVEHSISQITTITTITTTADASAREAALELRDTVSNIL
jgi:hypothetical protein